MIETEDFSWDGQKVDARVRISKKKGFLTENSTKGNKKSTQATDEKLIINALGSYMAITRVRLGLSNLCQTCAWTPWFKHVDIKTPLFDTRILLSRSGIHVLQTTSLAKRGRVWSHYNHVVVGEERNYRTEQRCWHPLNTRHIVFYDNGSNLGSDWSHQVSAMVTTLWLQCVTCETRIHAQFCFMRYTKPI